MDILSVKKALSFLLESNQKIFARTEKYLNMQDPTFTLEFYKKDSDIKKEHSRLISFSTKLVSDIDRADGYVSILSGHLCQADGEMLIQIISVLSDALESYYLWRSSTLCFIENSEKIFSDQNGIRYSKLISETRALLTATGVFSDKLANTIKSIQI